MTLSPKCTPRALLFASFALALVASCNNAPEAPAGLASSGIGGLKTDGKKRAANDGNISGDEGQSKELDAGDLSDGGEASKETAAKQAAAAEGPPPPDKPIVYPAFDFNGKGTCTCKGKVHTSLAKITTALDAQNLTINMYYADLIVSGGKGQKEASKTIQASTGITQWQRPSPQEAQSLKDQGFDYAPYAIFAREAKKFRQNQVFAFDKPLPVFPWPAVASRYKALKDAPNQTKSWSANVTGAGNFQVVVSLTLISATATEIVIKLTTDIPADTTWQLYEIFPLPREATYHIDPQQLIVTRIDNLSLFFGDECKKQKESVRMAYLLCKRDAQGKVDQFPCQQ